MKRKRLDRDIWTSIVEKEYFQENINEPDFSGILSVLYLKKVFLILSGMLIMRHLQLHLQA